MGQRGSHVKFQHADGRRVTVPRHAREDVQRGTLLAIFEHAGIDADEFLAAFR